jgi:hypothetical protein
MKIKNFLSNLLILLFLCPSFSLSQPIFTRVNQSVGFTPLTNGHYDRPSWGDFNNDGYEDLALFNYQGYLYRNEAGQSFVDISSQAGVKELPHTGGGTVWGDYDNDGDLDVYKVIFFTTEPNQVPRDYLLRNNGNETFTNVAEEAGIATLRPTQDWTEAAAWGDYDADGWLDLYVANYDRTQGGGEPDFLYHNNRNGTFTNVAGTAIPQDSSCGRGVAWCDYDNDGDLDIYIGNYRLQANFLYRNNGDGSFTDVATQAGVAGGHHTLAVNWVDYDNDGDFDLYTTVVHGSNILYQNNGAGIFTDVTQTAGVRGTFDAGGACWADFNNDGFIDLFTQDIYDNDRFYLYQNNGDGTFTEVPPSQSGIIVGGNGYASSWADYDRDGDMDLVTTTRPDPQYTSHLYRNNGNNNHWIVIKLVGDHCNTSAIGARVKVVAGNLSQLREVCGGMGCGAQNMLPVHFGLGENTSIDLLEVRWPCGRVDQEEDIPVDRWITRVEGWSERKVDVPKNSQTFPFLQNHTNPFNPNCHLLVKLKERKRVTIRIYNILGQLVKEVKNLGKDRIDVSSGMYFYEIETEGVKRTVVLK